MKTFSEMALEMSVQTSDIVESQDVQSVQKKMMLMIAMLPDDYKYEYTKKGVNVTLHGKFVGEIKVQDSMNDAENLLKSFEKKHKIKRKQNNIMDLGDLDWDKQSHNGWTGD